MSPVNIVVPVYRDVSLTRRCLDSLDASGLPLDCRVTLIDDASPEDGMADMLKTFVEARLFSAPLVVEYELLRNAENLGFVASANRGMAHCPEHDVVLLNSDTEVPPGWLQRLRAAAYRRKDIGTVTPFSNCGSLASYPVPNAENAMPAGSSLERLDRYFQTANADLTVDVPIGVGFCLFIRRDCLDDTGSFDEIAFNKGYGEENDFCLRAAKRGWAHVLAANCFVFHKGRGSFGREKDELVRQAYVFLSERYPNYPVLLQNHFSDDPARLCRLRVDFLRLADRSDEICLVVGAEHTPDIGRGASDKPVLELSRIRAGFLSLRWLNAGEAFKLWFSIPKDADALREVLIALGVKKAQGVDQAWMRVLSILPNTSVVSGTHAGVFEIIARHSVPRLYGWGAFTRVLARLVQGVWGVRLLRPLAIRFPEAARRRVRNWIKANRL